jgi:signal transduction histidine kinase
MQREDMMKATEIERKHKEQHVVLRRLQQGAEMRRRYIAHIPRWRQPLVGYLVTLPFVAVATIFTVLMKYILPRFYFPGSTMLLAIILVALLWGIGPALFSVFLSTISLDYFYIPSGSQFSIDSRDGLIQILPFFLIGILIAIISGQREAARRRALFAEQALTERADDLEQANEELKEVNKAKDQLISMASHELKTPITTIRGQAQVMLRRLKKQKELPHEFVDVRTALERIDEQTYRLSTLVDDLLDLGSIRAGKIELRLGGCDLREVCRSAVNEQHLLTERVIDVEMPETSVMLEADSERLGQVVTNLVSNAIKYSPEGSPVRVRVVMKENTAQLAVQDSGEGIAKEQQDLIFETFYRAPDAQSSQKRGWGLGLAICKDIVERHGGRIWCESRKGEGSTFYVELPLHP